MTIKRRMLDALNEGMREIASEEKKQPRSRGIQRPPTVADLKRMQKRHHNNPKALQLIDNLIRERLEARDRNEAAK